jgi:hypothetical protein
LSVDDVRIELNLRYEQMKSSGKHSQRWIMHIIWEPVLRVSATGVARLGTNQLSVDNVLQVNRKQQ